MLNEIARLVKVGKKKLSRDQAEELFQMTMRLMAGVDLTPKQDEFLVRLHSQKTDSPRMKWGGAVNLR